MNSIKGTIKEIESDGNLSITTVQLTSDIAFKAIVIGTEQSVSFLTRENQVNLLFKETEVSLASSHHTDLGVENHVQGLITHFENGQLLTEVSLDTTLGTIVSILSTSEASRLGLKVGARVWAYIKINEIVISG